MGTKSHASSHPSVLQTALNHSHHHIYLHESIPFHGWFGGLRLLMPVSPDIQGPSFSHRSGKTSMQDWCFSRQVNTAGLYMKHNTAESPSLEYNYHIWTVLNINFTTCVQKLETVEYCYIYGRNPTTLDMSTATCSHVHVTAYYYTVPADVFSVPPEVLLHFCSKYDCPTFFLLNAASERCLQRQKTTKSIGETIRDVWK